MKLAVICLLVVVAYSTAQHIRLPLPYEVQVRNGGLPLPERLRHQNPYWANNFDFPENRIVGGRTAQLGEAPFQISLRRTSHSCGGSIINKRTIVTAAHCVDGASVSALSVRYNTLTHGSGGTIVALERYVKHESYSSSTLNNDIALLITSTDLTLSQTQADAIALPEQGNDPSEGDSVDVSGWGATREGGSLPTDLQVVTVPIVSRANCNAAYGGDITDQMICAGVTEGGLDSCQGDSGGPLYSTGSPKRLLGVVSWGYGCARPNYPGVYARVGSFISWIAANQQN